MSGDGYFTRLAAVLFTAALIGAVIAKPNAGKHYVEKAAAVAAAADGAPMATRACAIGEPALAGPFAPIDDVLSVSPLGGVTAPGEILPAPYIRINMRRGDTAFERRTTQALAPAKADIIALERKIDRDPYGRATAQRWTVHFRSCEKISFYYDRLTTLSDEILRRAGGFDVFTELGGPDHIAADVRIRVYAGDAIGDTDGFDIGLHDLGAKPAAMARPERYRTNPYARAAVFDASPSLIKTITPETGRARCAIDYLPQDQQSKWISKLGDSWGIRRAKGDNACRTALVDTPDAVQGAWFTDAAHNAATTKVSAIALAADAIDPDRLIFALHGRLPSLTPSLIGLAPMMEAERAAATKDFISFKIGSGRINTPFNKTKDEQIYCYEDLRANFVGPRINGIILLQPKHEGEDLGHLKIEARGDVLSCIDLEEPWAFTGNETAFYR